MTDLLYDLTYTGPEVQAILDEARKLLLGVYATQSWVLSRGYATQQWVDQQTANFVTQSWVQQQGYLTSAALTGYATEQWVGQNFVPLSGNSTIAGIISIKSQLNIVNSAGETNIAMFGSSGQIHATNIYLGGTATGNLAATRAWVGEQGYQANVLESVKVNGSTLTITNKAVDIPLANDAGTVAGVVLIGDGLKTVENHLEPDFDVVASMQWVGQQGYMSASDIGYMAGTGSVSCQDITSSDVKVQTSGMTYSRTGNSYTLNGNNINGRLIVNARFSVTGGAIILVTVTPSTEANYDFGVIGFMDQDTLSANDVTSDKIRNNTVQVLAYSSGTSAVSSYIVASPGNHSIEIGYVKDSSGSSNQDKVTISFEVVGYATEQWVGQNFVPLSGNSTIAGTISIKTQLNIVNSAGETNIAMFGSSGQIHATNIYLGGTATGNLAATRAWVGEQGYQANVLESVKVNGSTLTITNKAVDIPLANDAGTVAGVVLIGDGLKTVENHLEPDFDVVASRQWVTDNFSPGGGGSSTLSGLTDVNISGAQNGQVLTYNSSTGKWVNAAGGGGGGDYLPLSGGTMNGNITMASSYGIKYQSKNNDWMLMGNAGTKQLSAVLSNLLDQLSYYIGAKITMSYNSATDSYTFTTVSFPQEYHGQSSGFFYVNGTIGYDWQYQQSVSGYAEVRIDRMVFELIGSTILTPVTTSGHVLVFNGNGEIVDSGVTLTTDQLSICTMEAARLLNAYHGKRFIASTYTETVTPSDILCNFMLKSDGMQELDKLESVVFLAGQVDGSTGIKIVVGVPTTQSTWDAAKTYIQNRYRDLNVWVTADGSAQISGSVKKSFFSPSGTPSDMGSDLWNDYMYKMYSVPFTVSQGMTSGFTIVIEGVKISDGKMYEKRFNIM